MKRHFVVVLLILSLALSALAQEPRPQAASTVSDQQVVAIQSVLTEVRDALVRVQKTLKGKKYPPLAAITLTLQTVTSKEGGFQFKLWVITIGGKWEKEKSQEVVIQLTPPSHLDPSQVATQSLTSALESAIVSAAEGAQDAGSQEFPLNFSGLSANIGFTVKKTGNAGASIEISPVTVDFSGSLSKTAVHSLKVVFGKIE
jgi:hypothetical protein